MLLAAISVPASADDKYRVIYPNIDGLGTDAFGYRALQLALAKSGKPYHAELLPISVNHARAREMLDNGAISICDFGTSAAYEEKYRAVYFPIDRGLNGLRLLLVKPATERRLAEMKAPDLFSLKLGQGHDWSDVQILEHAGFIVSPAPNLANLFPMLQTDRFDALPLGLDEIYELKARYADQAPDVVIDRYFVIRYPFARLFFVKKDNGELAEAVKRGLDRAFSDGSFQALFRANQTYAEALKHADLSARHMVTIDNPLATPQFHMIPSAYFLAVEQLSQARP